MGISGLLPLLKPVAMRSDNICSFAGQAVAVDASSWFHKSVYSIADHYVESSGADRKSVEVSCKYMKRRCEELLQFARVRKIYLVLDGQRCPLKVITNDERERKRQENLAQARQYRQTGQRSQMFEKYKACIKVRNELVQAVAKQLQRMFSKSQMEVVHAPYEADAQLVRLCRDGRAHAIITEDSDVLVYLAACRLSTSVLFKLHRDRGTCDVYSMEWLFTPMTPRSTSETKLSNMESVAETLNLRESRFPGRGARLFVQSCVLAGCDYAPNLLQGVGTVNAFRSLSQVLHRPAGERFRSALVGLPKKARQDISDPSEYELLLAKSEAVFYYHPVIDQEGNQVFLCGVEGDSERPVMDRFEGDWSFLGQPLDNAPPMPEVVVPKRKAVSLKSNPYSQPLRTRDCNVVNPEPPSKKAKKINPFDFLKRAVPEDGDVRFAKLPDFPKDGTQILRSLPIPEPPQERVSDVAKTASTNEVECRPSSEWIPEAANRRPTPATVPSTEYSESTTQSKFFQSYCVRRVTMEEEDQPSLSLPRHDKQPQYNDFLESPERTCLDLTQDDIVESSPCRVPASQLLEEPKKGPIRKLVGPLQLAFQKQKVRSVEQQRKAFALFHSQRKR